MNSGKEKISVIIAVFNGEEFLAEAIDSVISQTYKAHEIIIVDDGSNDDSASIAKSYSEIDYYYQKNEGVSSALNLGLSKIKGDFISFLDADDIWVENKLEKQIEFFREHPKIEGVFAYHQRFYEKPSEELTEAEKSDTKRILPGYFKGTLLIRKDSFFRVGLFNTSLKMGDFLDWYRRASDMEINLKNIPDILLKRRIHDKNSSLINRSSMNDYLRIMKDSLDRRRKK